MYFGLSQLVMLKSCLIVNRLKFVELVVDFFHHRRLADVGKTLGKHKLARQRKRICQHLGFGLSKLFQVI